MVASAVLTGCVATNDDRPAATKVSAKRLERAARVTTTAPPTTLLATTTTPTTLGARVVAQSAPRAPRVARPAAAPSVVRTSPQPGAVWARFNGQLTGGNYIVARPHGSSLAVSPSPDAAPAASLSNPLPSGAPRTVVVVADAGDWLQVLLPMRPNSSVGWVRKADVSLSSVDYRVEIDRAAHHLRVFDGDHVVGSEPIAVGKRNTPTPVGQFFIVELLQPPNPGGAYGPYAFTLSAYSEVYQTFGSGDGAVGIHGTNEPGAIGTDASHGCIRMHNDPISHFAGILPLGTPVFIR